MGIYYTNYLYYGFIIDSIVSEKCKLTTNLKIMKISNNCFLLYSKILKIDDGVPSLSQVPETFICSKLKNLNQELDNDFFTENLYTEDLTDSVKDIPRFNVCCYSVSSLDNFSTGQLLYNKIVDLNI